MSHPGLQVIRAKLAAYRRKLYLYRALRGGILLLLVLLAAVLLLLVGEGILWMSVAARTWTVFLLLLTALLLTVFWVLRPLLNAYGIGTVLSDRETAVRIGNHFPQVRDRLLNYLEWNDAANADNHLLVAAIEQRTEELRPLPVVSAISYRPNWRLARWVLLPLALGALVGMLRPDWVTGSSVRLARFREPFVPPPPFQVDVRGHRGQLVVGQDMPLDIRVAGRELPGDLRLYVQRDGEAQFYPVALQRVSSVQYRYTFASAQSGFRYYVGNERYGAPVLTTEVLTRPRMQAFSLRLVPPAYTGLRPDSVGMGVGQFRVVQGSAATLRVGGALPGDSVWVEGDAGFRRVSQAQFQARLMAPGSFRIRMRNRAGLENTDTVAYRFTVLPDRSPTVDLVAPEAELFVPATGIVDIAALVQDDYGLRRAELVYRFVQSNDKRKVSEAFRTLPLALPGSGSSQRLLASVDFFGLDVRNGDIVEYAVRAWDNDGVQGSKSGQSALQRLVYASTDALYENLAEQNEQFEGTLESAIERSVQLAKEIDELQRRLLSKREASYEDRQQLQRLLQEQQQVQIQIAAAREQLKQSEELTRENQLSAPEQAKRLDDLNKLLQDLDQRELLQMLQELNRQQRNPRDRQSLQSMLMQMQQKNRDTKADLERIRKLFQQWKVKQKLDELSRRLQEEAQRQQQLEQQTRNARKDELARLAEQQRNLNEETRQNNQTLDELRQLEQRDNNPQPPNADGLRQDYQQPVEQAQQEAQQNLQQQNRAGAQQRQQQSVQQLQRMQQKVEQMKRDAERSQTQENYDDLRQLLKNLLKLSFDQEALRADVDGLEEQDPAVMQAERRQARLADDMRMVRDSLEALAQRAIEVKQAVLQETRGIADNMAGIQQALEERQLGAASTYQNNVKTGLNVLANMLTESLQNMQNQLRAQMQQQGQDQNPMPGNLQGLIQEQRDLNQAMENLQRLAEQKQAEERQQGEGQPQPGEEEYMEQLREMAEKQAQIRERLNQLYEQLQQEGQGRLGTLGKAQQDMQQTEQELQAEQLRRETILRQQGILNRMLDFDKAMRVKEKDEQRKSRTATDLAQPDAPEWQRATDDARLWREQLYRARQQYAPAYQRLIDDYQRALPTTPAPQR